MNYQSIVDLFLHTPAENWQKVSGNHEYAFCKEDVNLRIVSTLQGEDVQQEDFKADWANNFPDQRAVGYFYNLYYGPTLIHRFILVSVDGARAMLPVPALGSMNVTEAQWKVAEIFDTTGSFIDYAHRTGLIGGMVTGM